MSEVLLTTYNMNEANENVYYSQTNVTSVVIRYDNINIYTGGKNHLDYLPNVTSFRKTLV